MSDGSTPSPLPAHESAGGWPVPPNGESPAPSGEESSTGSGGESSTWSGGEPSTWPGEESSTWPGGGSPAALPASSAPSAGTRRDSVLVIVAVGMSALALAMSTLVILAQLAFVGVVAMDWYAGGGVEDPYELGFEFVPGSVEEADGTIVEGVGTYERPAVLGEHTLSWPTDAGGVVDITVTGVDWEADAAVAAADPANPPPGPGMTYVQAQIEVEYIGPGRFVPVDALFLSLETSSWICYEGELGVATAAPLWDTGDLVDGEEASASVVFEMPEGERSSARFGVETRDGELLYLAER